MGRSEGAWLWTTVSAFAAVAIWQLHQRILFGFEGGIPDRLSWMGLLAFATATLVAFLILSAFRVWRFRRVEDTPRSRVRSMAAGPVELDGKAGEGELVAPFSGRRCVYYAYRVSNQGEELGRHDSSRYPIRFEDESGGAWIDADGAEIRGARSTVFGEALSMGRFGHDALAHLDALGVRPWQPVRIEETCIEPSAPLFLHGFYDAGRTRYDAASDCAESPSTRSLQTPLDLGTDPVVGRDSTGCAPFFLYAKRQRVFLGRDRELWLARLRIGAAYGVALALLGGAFSGAAFWILLIGFTPFATAVGAALYFFVQTQKGRSLLRGT